MKDFLDDYMIIKYPRHETPFKEKALAFLKELLCGLAPFVGVSFAAGFALGAIVNVWCLSSLFP